MSNSESNEVRFVFFVDIKTNKFYVNKGGRKFIKSCRVHLISNRKTLFLYMGEGALKCTWDLSSHFVLGTS